MSIRYERDDVRRRVVVTVQGTIELDDALAVIERQRVDDAWSYAARSDIGVTARGIATRQWLSRATTRSMTPSPPNCASSVQKWRSSHGGWPSS